MFTVDVKYKIPDSGISFLIASSPKKPDLNCNLPKPVFVIVNLYIVFIVSEKF